jgi:hypothetical protein
MKLYSAVGIEDFSNPLTVQGVGDATIRRLGLLDWFNMSAHGSYIPIPTPGKGLNLSAYANQTGFPLKDIIAEYPTGDCWIAFGVMIDPITIIQQGGSFFSVSTSNTTVYVPMSALSRYDILQTWGQGKRCCVELVWKPLTGVYKVFVNGIQRASGTASAWNTGAYPMSTHIVNFNAYAVNDSTTRMYVTDAYIGVVDSIDDRLGNFKIQKLAQKTSTLNADGMTPGGPVQLATGDHTVEFDTAPLAGSIVCGVAETVRALSQGPTASVTTKRTINGSETAARKAGPIPVTPPAIVIDEFAAPRVMAPPTPYVLGTPLTECKLTLSIVNN